MSPRGKEKRRHGRLQERVTLRTVSTAGLGTIVMETSNLSLGGAYCLSDREIPPLTRLQLNIFLPSTDGRTAQLHYPIEVDAVVVRTEPLNGDGTPAAADPEARVSSGPVPVGADAEDRAPAGEAGVVGDPERARRREGPPSEEGEPRYRLAVFFSGMAEKDRQLLSRYLSGSAS